MHRKATVLLLLIIFSPFCQGQIPPLSFEAADVKMIKSGEVRMAVDFLPGGRLSMHNVPMKVLILMAYHVRPETITGGPGWLEADRFDIVAKASQTTSQDDLRRMLQTLLAERFKLVVHTDRKLMPAYALVTGENGPKLQASEAGLLTEQRCESGAGSEGQKHVTCRHITMAALADTLQEIASRDIDVPVVDQTGLAGSFDLKLDWVPAVRLVAGQLPVESAGPTLFEAMEVQLGLRLESKKLPLPVVVIDRVERVPTEN
jgi:uncharacterized protein (TIGR03435 family)